MRKVFCRSTHSRERQPGWWHNHRPATSCAHCLPTPSPYLVLHLCAHLCPPAPGLEHPGLCGPAWLVMEEPCRFNDWGVEGLSAAASGLVARMTLVHGIEVHLLAGALNSLSSWWEKVSLSPQDSTRQRACFLLPWEE